MRRRGTTWWGRFFEQVRRFFQQVFGSIANAWNMFVGFFIWIGHSISNAWGSRHLRYMIQGLPALFATILAVIFVVAMFTQGKEHLAQPYNVEAKKALGNQNYELAKTFASRATELKVHNDEDKMLLVHALNGEASNMLKDVDGLFKEANTLSASKKDAEADAKKELANAKFQAAIQEGARAAAIANSLAPKDRTGYPPAHLWMAGFIAQNAQPPVTDDTVRQIEMHLYRAYKGGSEQDATKYVDEIRNAGEQLGRLFWSQNRKDEAEPYLKQVAERKPIFKLTLGQYYREKNRPEEAKRLFESAADYFRRKCDPSIDKTANMDDHESRINWVRALTVQDSMEKLDEAMKVVEKGRMLKPDEIRYTQFLSAICADKELRLSKQPNSSLEERLALIQYGLQVLPNNPALLRRLVQLSDQKGEEGEKSKKMMERMLADEKAAPILHFIMGSRAFSENKPDVAQYHWEQAYKLDPSKSPLVANNLAAVMIQPKDVSQQTLQQALEMINGAIKKVNAPQFHDTRGQIQFKLGNYKEAIVDLVYGLQNTTEPNLAAHDALAGAYEKMGDKIKSEAHRQKADELRKQRVRPNIPISKPWSPDEQPTEPGKDLPPAGNDMPQPPVVPPTDKPESKDKKQ